MTERAVPSRLRVRLLGELALRRGEEVLPLPASRRTRALLAYLVATGAPQSRSALCDLLWDGPEDPRASLRWSLTKLRSVVDDRDSQRLVTDRDRVGFQARDCDVDVETLRALLPERGGSADGGDARASGGASRGASSGGGASGGAAAGQAPATSGVTAAVTAAGIAAASVETLEQAADLLRGEFLDGLELPTCYRFHHWCLAEREGYGSVRRSVLETLTSRLAHEPERALFHGRAMVAADPLAENAHAVVVRLLAAAGRYPEAEQHYAWAREVLVREVAMPSGGPLDEAIRRIRRERSEAAAAPPSALHAAGAVGPEAKTAKSLDADAARPAEEPAGKPPEQPLQEPPEQSPKQPAEQASIEAIPPLVGRELERRAIVEAINGDARSRLLLFTGEPGIGKTRLLDEFAAAASAAGSQVIRGRCFEAEMVRPYGLWLDALRGVSTEGVDAAILHQAGPLLAGHVSDGGNRGRLFDAVTSLLGSLALRRPLAVVLDDLQWIDEGSAALLHFLARTSGAGPPLRFAAAARAAEVGDNAAARRLLQSLARESGMRAFPLAPLTPAEADALVGAVPLDASVAWRQTGGNPLYLSELVRAARRGADTAGQAVDALIHARLRSLDDSARELLNWAAAAGGEVRPELLGEAAGLAVTEVLSRLDRLERHGLMAPAAQGHFDFAHDLVREAIYRLLSQPHRQAIHRQFVRALFAAAADEPWLHGEIVHHAEMAGDTLAAAQACAAAGEFCLRVFANEQAAEVAERGLAHVVKVPPGTARRARIEIALLRLRVAAAAVPGGRRLPALAGRIESAIAAAEALGLHVQAAAGWEILAFWRQQASDSGRTAEATLAAERTTRRSDATTRCLQLANSGRCLLDIEADPVRGRELLDEAAALSGELGLKVMEIEWGRGLAARADGDLEGARAALSRAVAMARLAENHWREFECMIWLATVELEQGLLQAVLGHVDEVVAAAARMGESQAPFAQALAALARLRSGDAAAEPLLAASVGGLRDRDDKAHLAYALNESAALALGSGRAEAAAACASEALAVAQAVRRPTEVAVAMARLVTARLDMAGLAAAATGAKVDARWPPPWPVSGAPSARAARAIAEAARAVQTSASTASP